MKKDLFLKNIFLPFVLLVCGVCYSFILPPYSQYDLAWFGLAPLLIVLRFCRPKRGFMAGLYFGIGFWTPAISWFISLGNKGCPFFLVVIAYILLVLACAFFVALFSMLVARLWQGVNYISYEAYMEEYDRIEAIEDDRQYERESKLHKQKMKAMAWQISFAETWRVPVIALMWVGLEYLRGLAGFSWNTLAISQYKSYPVAQLAAIGGTAAISFLIVCVNAGIAGVGIRIWRMMYAREYPKIKRHFDLWFAMAVVLIAMMSGMSVYKTVERDTRSIESANELILVGAINNHDTPYKQKQMNSTEIFNELLQFTYEFSTNQFDVVIWPETSVPFLLPEEQFDVLINQFVLKGDFQLMVGGVEKADLSAKEFNLGYNVSYLYSPDKEKTIYRKRHLVPFGEYLPLDETIPFIRNFAPFGYSVRSGEGAQLFELKGIKTGALICFEDTFSWPARESVKAGARVLVSQSNDMWFDSYVEKLQHHANAVFRAIETRTPLIRVSNEGYMGVVLPSGRVETLYSSEEDILREYVVPRPKNIAPTFYMQVGDWILAKPASIFVIGFIVFMVYERRKIKSEIVA